MCGNLQSDPTILPGIVAQKELEMFNACSSIVNVEVCKQTFSAMFSSLKL